MTESKTTIKLNSIGLRSKWGFDDGDINLGNFDDLLIAEPRDRHLPFRHEVLARVVEKYIVPSLPADVKVYRIGTCHNPIRMEDPTRKDFSDIEVEINSTDVREIAEQLSKEWCST